MKAHVNVRRSERWASAIGGIALAAAGVKRLVEREIGPAGALLTTAGAGLLLRGATGHCSVYAAAGIDTTKSRSDTRRRLSGPGGVNVEEAVTINQSPLDLYLLWRDLAWLPAIVPDLLAVHVIDAKRSHWTAAGPKGRRIEWTAEIINEIPGELIAWRTIGHADLVSAGSVHFDAAPGGRGAIVRIRLQYDPPAGKIGAAAAWLIGKEPSQSIREGLRRFKQLIEAGEMPRNQSPSRGAR